ARGRVGRCAGHTDGFHGSNRKCDCDRAGDGCRNGFGKSCLPHEGVLKAMVVAKIKIATTIGLIVLTCSGACLLGYSSLGAGQNSPIQAPAPKNKETRLGNKDNEGKDVRKPTAKD